MENYYKVLELPLDATEKEIRKQYRQKSLLYHPDRFPNDPQKIEMFHLITLAVDTLTDPQRRKVHDDRVKLEMMKEERMREMDEYRRQGRMDLEKREEMAKRRSDKEEEALEVERIRQKTNLQMKAMMEQRRQQTSTIIIHAQRIKKAQDEIAKASTTDCSLKIKLKDHTVQDLKQKLSEYDLDDILVSKNGKSCICIFKTVAHAMWHSGLKLNWIEEPSMLESVRVLDGTSAERTTIYSSKENKTHEYEQQTLHKLKSQQ
ncbi:hypothetical protein EDD86DRAFT_246233 [Gorgonomyces haynaldii]|nr:hypothetical protein EDD86DRAFT_246233 [Gorgonomyces haynaldii]